MDHEEPLPQRKHLTRLREVWLQPPVYFVTICSIDWRRVLVPALAQVIADSLGEAAANNQWSVGRYVVMPDHVHFFAAPKTFEVSLSAFVGGTKQLSTRKAWALGHQGRLWQAEFFDHVLRSEEAYNSKWEYVRLNPVRAGLCQEAEHWPHQGEISILECH